MQEESVKGAFKAISEHSELDANGMICYQVLERIANVLRSISSEKNSSKCERN